MATQSRDFKVQFWPTSKRTEIVRNEVFSVFPVVALVEGVLHSASSEFPELALASEFGAVPPAWDGVPVVLSHPKINGKYVSANLPQVFGSSTMGFMFNTKVEDNKLKSEIWINRKWAAENGQQHILDELDSGRSMEVSTGLFTNVEEVQGEFGGKQFFGIWRNVMPDHLAILPPGSTGACSIEMGCGVPRTNEGADMTTKSDETTPQNDPKTNSGGTAGGCACTGATASAQSATQPATQTDDPPVTQKSLARFVSELIKVFSGKTEVTPEAGTSTVAPAASAASATSATSTAADAAAQAQAPAETLEQLAANASPSLKSELEALISLRDNTIAQFVNEIKSSSANAFTDDDLKAMNLSQLQKLAALAKASRNNASGNSAGSDSNEAADFSGRGAARQNSEGDLGYTPPKLVFPRKSA